MSAFVTLIGNVGKVENKNGNLLISLAVNAGSKNEKKEYVADWYNGIIFAGTLQDKVANLNLVPGSRVIATGKLLTQSYTSSNGEVRKNNQVILSSIEKQYIPDNKSGNGTKTNNGNTNTKAGNKSTGQQDYQQKQPTPSEDDIPF